MASPLALKPTHGPVRAYYLALAQLANVGATHESAVREAWHTLIEHCAGPLKWTLVREYAVNPSGAAPLRLVGQVITVSVETMKPVTTLPPLDDAQPSRPPSRPPAGVYTQADFDAAHIYVSEDRPSASP
jgi:hypothetical protein